MLLLRALKRPKLAFGIEKYSRVDRLHADGATIIKKKLWCSESSHDIQNDTTFEEV
jgi:hypothetical protein